MTNFSFPYISLAEATELLGVSRATIDRWRQSKQLPYIKIGKEVLFDVKKLEQWVETYQQNEIPHSSHSASSQPITLNIGYQTTSALLWSPLIMKEQFLLEEQLKLAFPNTSFDIQWINAPNGMELIEQLIAGTVHIASVGDYPISMSWQLSGVLPHFNPVLLAFDGKTNQHHGISLVIPSDSKLKHVDQFNELSISAVCGSSSSYRLSQWRNQHEVQSETITHRNMDHCLHDIVNRQTGGSMLWEPYLSWAQLSGAGILIPSQLSNEKYLTGVIANEGWIHQNEGIVISYLKAHLQAHQLLRKNQNLAARLIQKASGFPGEIISHSLSRIHWDALVYEQDLIALLHMKQTLSPRIELEHAERSGVSTYFLQEAARSLKLPSLPLSPVQGEWSRDYVY